MINILKKIKQQEEEIERLNVRVQSAENVSGNYCGWVFAYRNAIIDMNRDGNLSNEQSDMLFDKARKYYSYWQTH